MTSVFERRRKSVYCSTRFIWMMLVPLFDYSSASSAAAERHFICDCCSCCCDDCDCYDNDPAKFRCSPGWEDVTPRLDLSMNSNPDQDSCSVETACKNIDCGEEGKCSGGQCVSCNNGLFGNDCQHQVASSNAGVLKIRVFSQAEPMLKSQ